MERWSRRCAVPLRSVNTQAYPGVDELTLYGEAVCLLQYPVPSNVTCDVACSTTSSFLEVDENISRTLFTNDCIICVDVPKSSDFFFVCSYMYILIIIINILIIIINILINNIFCVVNFIIFITINNIYIYLFYVYC